MKAICRCFHAVARLFQGRKYTAHMLQEQCSGMGQPRAASGASKERYAQFFF
ncbi:hypothetical protein D3C71_1119580 [compost metagenome]